ncbi:signal transduction histidine kinase [Sphingomonas kaistensis]|uniref:Signal transduction histidine kinase n=1 Tax=Sphingomonas kaistensis TaxID=298708 RepID=A0A7X5Y898_9SPHN|nr:histidine kinase [Sphingomonas kaistensis]NJC06987.1 signal transduction histidine kinase [Sphingomonas kaistensis]
MNMPLSSDRLIFGDELAPRRFADWRLAAKTIVGFWAIYIATIVIRAFLGSDPTTILLNKMLTILVGVVLTTLIYLAIATFATGPAIRRKAVVASAAVVVASLVHAAILVLSEGQQKTSKEEFRIQGRDGVVLIQKEGKVRIERSAADPVVFTMPTVQDMAQRDKLRLAADAAVIWLFFFGAWSAVYLALVSQRQALDLQKRAAAAESAAQVAQVRALRYQVNPHFLFNTLNSLSSLVMTGRPEEAEEMILKLSTFFRSSLSIDPTADVSLAEEIDLQRLYLDIEQVRFPRRLNVEIDVPEGLASARLPALILQPIVENAIKYGLGKTRDKVTLRIAAEEPLPGRLRIEVANFGGTILKTPRKPVPPAGTKVGLANVAQRLSARFGRAAGVEHGPLDGGGYRVALTLPTSRIDG